MKGETIRLDGFELGMGYSRVEMSRVGSVIPPAGSRDPHWSSGIIVFDNAVLLLVTLEKEEYGYLDNFDADLFWWQSQNQQTQLSPVMRRLESGSIEAQLFVRIKAKLNGKAAPFTYCGALSRPVMEGEKPVTCLFKAIDYVDDARGELRAIYLWRPHIETSLPERARRRSILASKPRASMMRGQGSLVDQESRKAIEDHAMRLASSHYTYLGYNVTDTSRTEAYDLEVKRLDTVRRVEVKGTQSTGEAVILTANEIQEARSAAELSLPTDLVIVHNVVLDRSNGASVASGGTLRKIEDWLPEDDDLFPTQFRYRVPIPS